MWGSTGTEMMEESVKRTGRRLGALAPIESLAAPPPERAVRLLSEEEGMGRPVAVKRWYASSSPACEDMFVAGGLLKIVFSKGLWYTINGSVLEGSDMDVR